jgi:AcrR family transcriptional regulator
MTLNSAEPGPGKRSDRTKAAILQATRKRLAAHGYDRTTIRAVAADAGIDAALDIDLRLPDLSAVPADELPRMLVRLFVDRWESDPTGDALLVLLRSAVTNEHAAAQMHQIFATQVAPALAAAMGEDRATRLAGVVAAQLLGLGLTRYLLRLPAVTALTPDQIEDALTPAIRATLQPGPG